MRANSFDQSQVFPVRMDVSCLLLHYLKRPAYLGELPSESSVSDLAFEGLGIRTQENLASCL